MSATELAAVFESGGTIDEAIAATGMNVSVEQYQRAFRRAVRRLVVDPKADVAMRLEEAVRLLDSREWKRLPASEQLERSVFLLRALTA